MDTDHALLTTRPWATVVTFTSIIILYHVCNAIYSLYFHPLHQIPGPRLAAISRIPYIRHLIRGTTIKYVHELHEKYGETVRYSPNEVSTIAGETAWQDIYGFRTGKQRYTDAFEKDPIWYAPSLDGVDSMLRSIGDNHGRQRRVISHAFSDRALRDQEGLLQGYANLLVDRLGETNSGGAVNLSRWYNWTTFDIIADLLIGEPFGNLATLTTHKHVELVFTSIKAFRFFYIMAYWPVVKWMGSWIIDQDVVAQRLEFAQWIKQHAKKRINTETQRPDFMTAILAHKEDEKSGTISEAEIYSNVQLMLIAGTETTATALSVATYYLLKYPEHLRELEKEVRSQFKSPSEVTIEAVNQLPYLIACLTEALRMIPPVAGGFSRKAPAGGAQVSGHYIPGDASISVTHYAAYHSKRNFRDPDVFAPERWLGDAKYADDNKAVFQPFSFGPRNCLGKNLAYAEMRLIMAKMILAFDMELDESSSEWAAGLKVLTLWDKPPLMVKLTPVAGATA